MRKVSEFKTCGEFFRGICGTLRHQTSVLSSSKKCGWFNTTFQYKHVIWEVLLLSFGRHWCWLTNSIFILNIFINVRGSLNKFPDFFRMGTFIDSTHMKLLSPSKKSPPVAMHLYRSNNFWKAPWKSSCVSVSMTFVTASFISSIVS